MTMDIMEPILGTAAAVAVGTVVGASTKRKYTKCIAYNGTAGVVVIEIYLIPPLGAVGVLTKYLKYPLAVDETYLCPEIIGASLNAGGQMYIKGLGVSFSAVANDTVGG